MSETRERSPLEALRWQVVNEGCQWADEDGDTCPDHLDRLDDWCMPCLVDVAVLRATPASDGGEVRVPKPGEVWRHRSSGGEVEVIRVYGQAGERRVCYGRPEWTEPLDMSLALWPLHYVKVEVEQPATLTREGEAVRLALLSALINADSDLSWARHRYAPADEHAELDATIRKVRDAKRLLNPTPDESRAAARFRAEGGGDV